MILCGLSAAVNSVSAQTWTPTSAPTNGWYSISASADGSKLAALNTRDVIGTIWVSTNSGITWTSNNIPGVTEEGLVRFAMSANGDKMAAVATFGSEFYTSTNYGVTWVSNSIPAEPWLSIASSADGSKLVALGGGSNGVGPIYVSADSGQTWTQANAPVTNWVSVASSANGSNWVAAVETFPPAAGGFIYTSTDCGLDWTLMTNAPNMQYLSVASSADGTKFIAAAGLNGLGAVVYTSTNSGATWISNAVPNYNWNRVASSADGRTLAAISIFNASGSGPGYIYTSTNSGTTWISNSVPIQYWADITSSADGGTLVACGATSLASSNGRIYSLQTFPAPELNISQVNSNLALSWLIPSTNFVVQQSPDLISWSSITDAPALNLTNLNNELSLSPTNSSSFFRLMSQ